MFRFRFAGRENPLYSPEETFSAYSSRRGSGAWERTLPTAMRLLPWSALWKDSLFCHVFLSTLIPEGKGTRLVLDHDAYPEGNSPMYPTWHEHLSANWPVFYFQPFAKYWRAR
jgi:hypothetical protein